MKSAKTLRKDRQTSVVKRVPSRVQPESIATEFDDAKHDTGALRRGLIILDAVIKAERPVSSGEIANIVGLSPSTTHRLLKALSDQEYLIRDGLKRYYPSVKALFPADLFHPLNVLRRIAIEQLLSLRQQFGQASSFVIFLAGKRWVLETIHGHEALSPYNENEVGAALHASVSGKIFLSTLSEAERDALLGPSPYLRHTASTITDRGRLFDEIGQISSKGYGASFDELLDGLSAVGAPIFAEPKRVIGALVLAGPSKNYANGGLQPMISAVTQVARLLSFASPDVRAVFRSLEQ